MNASVWHLVSTIGAIWLTASVVYVLGWIGGKRSVEDRLHSEYWRGVGDACERQDQRARAAALARIHPRGHPIEVIPASCDWDAWLAISKANSSARRAEQGRQP